MKLPWSVVRVANAVTTFALLAGIPRLPYNRSNALIVETVGRQSGKRRRIPVGFIDDGGSILVVVEDGARSQWVRNALAHGGSLRIFLRGAWRSARLRLIDADPETMLRRMGRVHAAFVPIASSTPAVIELLPDP